ncbi:MAG: M60 family metallopeptidase, partial [Alloprevotella sp.]|nr:M60 family metallopeptidase [Alloprevotella sp.]
GGAPFTPIADYPAVSVHIEGGFVNGYFDLTKGDTNADWAQMKRHLLTAPVADLKTRQLTFHMNRDALVDAVGNEMEKLLGIWEGLMVMERSKQGLEEYEGYFNNPLSVTAPGSNYMHATTWGTYYNTSTLGSIMNYTNMNENQGSIWGPAHEIGHIHQTPINLIGTTEVSNNLYSNIAVYEQGRATSRCKSIQVTFDRFQEGLSWPDRLFSASGEADLWESTHLYWQLYQFFHIQGFKPDFYPELYKAFRRSPMNSRRQNQFVSASEDYLKFYETCCTVSGYDLTEFFAAYGFFSLPTTQSVTLNGTTREAHYVGDYGDFYLTATQAEIDQSLRRIKSRNLKPCNIIFIEDRITAPAATYEGASARAKKVSYATGDSSIGEIRKCGKVGQYTDFVPEDAITGTYIYKENAFTAYSEVAISGGSGAVGFKVYDAAGNLRVLSNEFTFRLPADLRGTDYKVYAAEGNGKDVRILREGEADPYDLNGDGSVDVADVTELVSIVLGGGA